MQARIKHQYNFSLNAPQRPPMTCNIHLTLVVCCIGKLTIAHMSCVTNWMHKEEWALSILLFLIVEK